MSYIPPTGFSANIKQARVSRILESKKVRFPTIYYSPRSVNWGWQMLFLVQFIFFFFQFQLFSNIWKEFIIGLAIYELFSYLVLSYFNNSFAINGSHFYVINPYTFSWKFIDYKIYDIVKIEVVEKKYAWYLWLFLSFENNYVKITTKKGVRKFYCIGLQEDSYDENMTELTLDDLKGRIEKLFLE